MRLLTARRCTWLAARKYGRQLDTPQVEFFSGGLKKVELILEMKQNSNLFGN